MNIDLLCSLYSPSFFLPLGLLHNSVSTTQCLCYRYLCTNFKGLPTLPGQMNFKMKLLGRCSPKGTRLGKQRAPLSGLEGSPFHWTHFKILLHNPYGEDLWSADSKDQSRDSDLVFEGYAQGRGILRLYISLYRIEKMSIHHIRESGKGTQAPLSPIEPFTLHLLFLEWISIILYNHTFAWFSHICSPAVSLPGISPGRLTLQSKISPLVLYFYIIRNFLTDIYYNCNYIIVYVCTFINQPPPTLPDIHIHSFNHLYISSP